MLFRVMLDTNIVSAILRARPMETRIEGKLLGLGDTACISIVSAGEVEFGLAYSHVDRVARNWQRLQAMARVVPFESPADIRYGEIRAHLARAGAPIGPNDLFIAAHALTLGVTLVTRNTDEFSRVPGLRIENWLD